MWEYLNDHVLAKIFLRLDLSDKLSASQVCHSWQKAFDHPDIWKKIRLTASDLHCLHYDQRTEKLITSHLKYCRCFSMDTSTLEAFNIVHALAQHAQNLQSLHLYKSQVMLDVTRGDIQKFSQSLTQLLMSATKLQSIDLDGIHFTPATMNERLPIGLPHAYTLQRLRLVNTLHSCNFCPLFFLTKLTELTITPHYLHCVLLRHLAQTEFKRLNIVTMPKSPDICGTLSSDLWREIKSTSSLTVGCYSMGFNIEQMSRLLNQEIPVDTVVFNVRDELTGRIDFLFSFKNTLKEYGCFSITKDIIWKETASFSKTGLIIAMYFQKLETLILQGNFSAGSIILMKMLNRNLRDLPFREDLVSYGCDFSMELFSSLCLINQDDEQFVLDHCLNRDMLETTMTELMGQPWRLLTKSEYNDWLYTKYRPYFGEFMI